jgi:predicted Zn-dependent protease
MKPSSSTRSVAAVVFSAVALAASLIACQTVEHTGRTQLAILSDDEEIQLGTEAYQKILAEARISSDARWSGVVARCGQRIAAVAERPHFPWEFKLVDDPKTVNAFCLPGGKVAFYTGILSICEDEKGIAVVMGHEVAHAVARHGNEKVSRALILQGGLSIAAVLTGMKDEGSQVAGAVVDLWLERPHGRDQESEADRIGLTLMAKAGYDPREAPKFWQRMQERSKGQGEVPQFLSTHPSHETRIKDLEFWMDEALPLYEGRGAASAGERER